MTGAEIRALILAAIGEIAPEADLAALGDTEDIREAVDLDSMDFVNLVSAICERTKVNIPESAYSRLYTLKGATEYLSELLARGETQSR
jgi:acyl carrier protein